MIPTDVARGSRPGPGPRPDPGRGGWRAFLVVALLALAGWGLPGAPAVAQSTGSDLRISAGDGKSGSDGAVGSSYRLDTGDQVSVTVFNEPDLSLDAARVRGDGTIAFPLIGQVRVRGLTTQEVESQITARLLDGYLKTPDVSVSVSQYRLFFIKGEVRSPGGYPYVEGLTVEKAVALAGGFTERASESGITLVREADPARPVKPVSPSTPVFPGDVLTVGQSFF